MYLLVISNIFKSQNCKYLQLIKGFLHHKRVVISIFPPASVGVFIANLGYLQHGLSCVILNKSVPSLDLC
jgi:hypothetical protein